MRFVIGGANGGKRDFVRENYGIDEILIADYDSVLTAKAVYDFYIFIKKLMADGKDIIAVIDETHVYLDLLEVLPASQLKGPTKDIGDHVFATMAQNLGDPMPDTDHS